MSNKIITIPLSCVYFLSASAFSADVNYTCSTPYVSYGGTLYSPQVNVTPFQNGTVELSGRAIWNVGVVQQNGNTLNNMSSLVQKITENLGMSIEAGVETATNGVVNTIYIENAYNNTITNNNAYPQTFASGYYIHNVSLTHTSSTDFRATWSLDGDSTHLIGGSKTSVLWVPHIIAGWGNASTAVTSGTRQITADTGDSVGGAPISVNLLPYIDNLSSTLHDTSNGVQYVGNHGNTLIGPHVITCTREASPFSVRVFQDKFQLSGEVGTTLSGLANWAITTDDVAQTFFISASLDWVTVPGSLINVKDAVTGEDLLNTSVYIGTRRSGALQLTVAQDNGAGTYTGYLTITVSVV
ncbi:hypothetical protein SP99_04578 [Enterobacter sp. BIDMC92]|uniref:hypothetical protein n=1 Tax=Enterobacter sp. BIDMC92 TaxID=1594172 RepID=UPI000659E5F0|nr:hypothetical protein [Enterobacter sp. BIDMC92]KLW85416.1 hypothetical protein SP99_04578 [Enterobacter sp. BIDMC92]